MFIESTDIFDLGLIVNYRPVLVDLTGELKTGILLGYLLQLYEINGGPFPFTDKEVGNLLRMTEGAVSAGRIKLRNMSFLSWERGEGQRNYYTVNLDRILELLEKMETSPETPLISVPKENSTRIEHVFNVWNEYRGKGEGETKWLGHRTLNFQISKAIQGALVECQGHENPPEIEIEHAIRNYAEVLLNKEYFWTHAWDLATFLTVKYGKSADSEKKWWQWLDEFFKPEKYKVTKEELPEHDEDMVMFLIKKYRNIIGNPDYEPTQETMTKFVRTSNLVNRMAKRKECKNKEIIDWLFEYLEEEVLREQNRRIHPGTLCSENTWNVFPQYLQEMGLY